MSDFTKRNREANDFLVGEYGDEPLEDDEGREFEEAEEPLEELTEDDFPSRDLPASECGGWERG